MAAMAMLGCSGGGGNTAPQGPAPGSGDAAFKQIATGILDDLFKRHPTQATDLGIHKYDAELDDYSAAAVNAESDAARAFKTRLAAIDPATLSLDQQLDREQLLRAAGQHGAAERRDQALGEGSRSLSERHHEHGLRDHEAQLRAAGRAAEGAHRARAGHARRRSPRRARTSTTRRRSSRRSRIEQIDGNVSFFKNDVPAAFKDVTDKALLAEFKKSNDAVIAALGSYKTFLQKELLPKSNGRLRARRRDVPKALAAQRDGRAAARSPAADRRGGPAEERGRVPGDREADRREQAGRGRAGRAPGSIIPPASDAAQDDAGHARFAAAVHRRSPHHHDSAVRSGAREGDAAVHARRRRPRRWTRRARSRPRSSTASTT